MLMYIDTDMKEANKLHFLIEDCGENNKFVEIPISIFPVTCSNAKRISHGLLV